MGVLGELLVEAHQLPDLFAEGGALLGLVDVDLLDLALEVAELGAQRIEDGAEGGVVLLGEAAGFFLEDVVGQRLELIGELSAGGQEQLDLLGRRLALFLATAAQLRQTLPRLAEQAGGVVALFGEAGHFSAQAVGLRAPRFEGGVAGTELLPEIGGRLAPVRELLFSPAVGVGGLGARLAELLFQPARLVVALAERGLQAGRLGQKFALAGL